MAFALAPPAEVPTLNMSCSASSLPGGREGALEGVTPGQYLARKFDQRRNVDVCGLFVQGSTGRHVFQCAHATGAGIAKTLNGIEIPRCPSLPGQPCVDERITEFVWQGVCEKTGQAEKRITGKGWE